MQSLILRLLGVVLLACPAIGGCSRTPSRPPPEAGPIFTEVAAAAGIRFRQGHGGRRPLNILEATGSGCAWLDYDGDDRPDLFFAGQPRCALYRNRGDGTFEDVSAAAGVDREGFWIGCASGDYDGDGRTDLLATGYHRCALYRNRGARFEDVARAAGLSGDGWLSSAGFADVDADGHLDLYIGRYVRFGPSDLQYCRYGDTSLRVACGPDAYEPQLGRLYRNRGDGTFRDETRARGLAGAHGKTWGVAFGDYDDDGRQDLYLANDEMPGDLFHNLGKGRFENRGVVSGTATNRDGGVQGGMGADFGDYDGDGRLDLCVTTFWMEPSSLYRNDGGGLFTEVGYPAGLAAATLKRVGWGARWADFDHDGALDLFIANGHVRDAARVNDQETLEQPLQLFLNRGGGRFREAAAACGLDRRAAGRGAAAADYDGDGDLDLAVVDMEGPALLLRNQSPPGRHWLQVRVLTAGRDALGARVEVWSAGKRQVREIQTSGSVLSAQYPVAHFGLGSAARVERLTVRWPGGRTKTLTDLAGDRVVRIE